MTAMSAPMTQVAVRLRPFTNDDWPAAIEIANRIFPDSPRNLESALHWDVRWQPDKHFRHRLVAVDESGAIAATGTLQHMPWQFSPDTYEVVIEVDPAKQRRGIGTTLYEAFLAIARERHATLLRTDAKESLTDSLSFLAHRGFEEIQRHWESRLDVHAIDLDAFATAEPRAVQQGFAITTLEAELRAAGDLGRDTLLRQLYQLDCECNEDEPAFMPVTMQSFDRWCDDLFSTPNKLPDAHFLMKDGDRIVGLSALFRNLSLAHVLQQGFTAVARTHRGRGVAMALKVRGVRYARDHGYREIRTGNNTRNRPMLRINEAMGFVKQPAWVEFGKQL